MEKLQTLTKKNHNLIMTIALIYSHQRQKLFFEFMVYCVSHTAWFVGCTIWCVSQTPQDAHGNSRGLEGTSGGVLYMKKSFLDKEKKVIIGTCWPPLESYKNHFFWSLLLQADKHINSKLHYVHLGYSWTSIHTSPHLWTEFVFLFLVAVGLHMDRISELQTD